MLPAANLIPLDKGEEMVCPTAICIVLRRLSNFFLMPAAIAEAKNYLYPLQVGCDVRCGLDAAVHDARAFIEEYGHDPAYSLSSADAKIAFNRTSREEMLLQTAEHAPNLIRLANALYDKGKPYLRLGQELIRSQEGTQQGDPASGLLFALAIHPIARRIEDECTLVVYRL